MKDLICTECGINYTTTILVWPREDVPKEIMELILDPDDIDWIASVPKRIGKYFIPWMTEGSSFGCAHVERYPYKESTIVVGHHA